MLIKSSSIKNLPVISITQGKQVATIKDFLYDPFENKITAFILHPTNLFGSDKYLRYPDIKSIGKDALIIDSVLSIKNAKEIDQQLLQLKKHGSLLTQGKLVTEAGEKLGTVRDFLFEADTGQVQQLEVTQGGFADFKSGPKTVNIDNIVSMGPDATIVKIKTQDDITRQAQTQGLQGKLNEVTSYFKEPTTPHPESMSDLAEQPSSETRVYSDIEIPTAPPQMNTTPTETVTPLPTANLSQPEDRLSQYQSVAYNQISRLKNDRMDKQKKNAVGLFLTKTILDDNDNILAKRGDIITNKLLTQAEDLDLLDQILKNTSYDPLS